MDNERMEAEARARQMGVALGLPGDELASFAELSDDELRRRLALMRIQVRHLGASRWSEAQRETLECLRARLVERGELGDVADLSDVQIHLREQLDIDVAQDGLVEAGRLTPIVCGLIEGMSLALFHHTSSALLPRIERQGLIVGGQTNFFNTQAGVYLSTKRAGEPVVTYGLRAARVHGGEPIALRVRRTLAQIKPDPDDADLAWAQGVQFISAPVPPADVLIEARAPIDEGVARPPPAAPQIAGWPVRPV